ncbi:FtsX-like permease family protein, partial [Aquabacterium sp. UBA2148]|uniref:FtsX-like permease family protein n=1 Tax=Aquabacterium sp. UBA2148 TaxID=1946042 RepID=UPI00257FCEDA
MAGLMTSRERRAREWAVLRSLGATQGLLARVQRFELIGLGALAGALAASASLAIGWALSSRVFEFPWTAPWWWPLVGAVVGALLAWGAGWWSLRGVLARPVAMTLRRAD